MALISRSFTLRCCGGDIGVFALTLAVVWLYVGVPLDVCAVLGAKNARVRVYINKVARVYTS